MKKYLVSYCIEFTDGVKFFNKTLSFNEEASALTILQELQLGVHGDLLFKYHVVLISFWEV